MASVSDSTGDRLPKARAALLAVLTASCFGPYLTSGIRTEQVALLSVLAIGVILWRNSLRPNAYGRTILLLGLALATVATMVTVTAVIPAYTSRTPLSGLENLLLPAMGVVTGLVLLENRGQTRHAMRVVYLVILVALAINLVLQVVQSQGVALQLSAWWTGEAGRTIAQSAGAGGRYTGIFNQPFEGGLMYAVAMVLWYQVGSRRLVLAIPSLSVLLVGGFLLSSKVFFLAIAVVSIAFLLDIARNKRTVASLVSAVVGAMALIQASSALRLDTLSRYSGGEQLIGTLTGGRYGDASVTGDFAAQMVSSSPIYGFGLTGFPIPYDSAWMEWLAVGGLMGLTLGIAVLLTILLAASQPSAQPRPASTMLAWLALGACVGGPALSANRSSLLLWLLLTWTLFARDRESDRKPPTEGPPRGAGSHRWSSTTWATPRPHESRRQDGEHG